MNREQKKQRRRELRQRIKERKLATLDELDALESDESDVIETEKEEVAEKDYYSGPVMVEPAMEPAPTSFEELDVARETREKAEAVMEVSWDTEMLVRNILHDASMDASEKVEAMTAVADEFGSRVSTEMDGAEKEKDMDLLELEAIIAHDLRHETTSEKIHDFLTKAVLSASRRNSLDDSQFALVVKRNGKAVRKYPIHDKAHVRNALARAAQMISRGGQAASDAKAALSKIRAAAKKFGIEANAEKEKSSILIEKDASGKYRWVGWASNNFMDWDGEIVCEDAHKEYVEWLEKNKAVSPVFDTWHVPGTFRKNAIDFAMYEKGFLILSGQLEDDEAAGLFRIQKEVDLGMSIAAFVLGRDPKQPNVITKYRMYAVSDLPLNNAANPFTDFETVVKEVGMDKLEYLAQILGSKEKAEEFLQKTGMKQKELLDAGIESKEKIEAPPPVETPPAEPITEAKKEEPVPPETKTPDIDALIKQIMEKMDIDGLNAFVVQAKEAIEKVPVLEALVKELSEGTDDKVAEMLKPPAANFAWSQSKRPSQSEDNVIKDDDPLHKNVPGVPKDYWLSEVTQTAPVKVE